MAQYPQTGMDTYFLHQPNDGSNQSNMRSQYLSLYWAIDAYPCNETGAEKSVAKRKLLESMDATMRALINTP